MTLEDVKYKGYGILTSAEYDDSLNLWNGRYRVLDQDGIVVYESFTTPLDDERTAQEAAEAEARAWIDRDSTPLSSGQ